jgi:flagellar basal-body rod protein FlgC
MDLFAVFDISSAGMSVEQTRLAVAASNLANARTSRTADGSPYRPLSVVVQSTPAAHVNYADVAASLRADMLPRPVVQNVAQSQAAPRLVYDPGHPDADERGFVSLPPVDTLTTMLNLVAVSRGYEANLRAFDLTRSLIERTLEMGNRR